jgi:cytochrome c peroxidase
LAQSALLDQAKVLFKPIPDTAQAVSGDSSNAAMVELGKALYFDPRLSKSHRFLNRRA